MARQRGIVVPISASDNTERAFQAVNDRIAELQARLRTAESGGSKVGRSLGDGMSHAVPQVAAASGAIREFEGNLPIRAVERFLTTVLGLGPILSAAFPVVGAIAFAGILSEMLGKLVSLYESGLRAPVEIGRAFDQMTAKLELSNAELDLNNARLQQQIDKIEGHHNNGIQVALEEARVSADKLLDSLISDIKAVDELLKQHEVSSFLSVLTGEASTGKIEKDVKNDGDTLADAASDATHKFNEALLGAQGDKDRIAAAKRDYFATLDKDFGDFIDKYQARADSFKKLQQENDKAVSDAANAGQDFGAGSIDNTDYGADIKAAEGAVRAAQLLRDRLRSTQTGDDLSQRLDKDKGDKADAERSNKVREAAEKIAAAQRDLAAATAKAAEEAAQQTADAAKRSGEAALAALDDRHKRELISDRDYYAQRAAIQVAALKAEADAEQSKEDTLRSQIQGLNVSKLRPSNDEAGRNRDDSKILELQTQLNSLEEKRLGIVQKMADIKTQAATEDYEATKKANDETLKLQAQLEAQRGGSTSARKAELHKQFDDQRRAAGPAGAAAIDGLEQIADDQIDASDAEQTYQGKSTELSAKRQNISYQEDEGRINAKQAQQDRIASDREEAAALQPVIEAYEKLAEDGVNGAAAKVDQLKQKVLELQNPVNKVAEQVRANLGDAFEALFDNMEKGKKDLEEFGRTIEKLLLDQAYKQLIAPTVHQGLGSLVPSSRGGSTNTAASLGASALNGLLPGLGKLIPGSSGAGVSAGSGGITVQIINQGAPLTSGGVQMSGGTGDDFEQKVLSVILKDTDTNGIGIQSIINALQNG